MILSDLENYIEGNFLIAGVGNELSDIDKVGVELAKKGRELYPNLFIDCGTTPENYIDKFINSKIRTLVILDSVSFNNNEDVKIVQPEELSPQGISTHATSLNLLSDYLVNFGIKTVIVGIKPHPRDKEIGDRVLSKLLDLVKIKRETS